MTPLVLAYIFNIIVLIPIGLMTMLGGEKGGQLACQSKFPESEGFRTLVGSLWTAILIGSVLGLFFPVTMSALLLIQVIYKTLWHIGICNASNDQAALQRSSFGDRLDIPIGTHAWPPIATVPSPDESRLEKVAGVIAPSRPSRFRSNSWIQ